MFMIFILLSAVRLVISCSYKWEWSFINPSPGITRPPLSPVCFIHQSDSVLLVNSGNEIMHIFTVNQTAFDICEHRGLIGQIIPPNSSYSLSLSNQVSEVRLISQSIHNSCLRLQFSLTNETLDSCLTSDCIPMGPCFRHLPLPLSINQSDHMCSMAPDDWIVLENINNQQITFSIFSTEISCNSNFSIKINSSKIIAIPLPNIPESDVILITDSTNYNSYKQIHISPLISCSNNLCTEMVPTLLNTFSSPLAISLMSLVLFLAGVTFLLALCLRKRQKIANEECPPPKGEVTGHFELKNEGKISRDPEVKTRKKSGHVSPTAAQSAPSAPPATQEPARQSILLEKRSSQFSELLSKFN
ncbi:hypothetical protein LOD99_6850 [Oopsacas minuta]|uniref:Uncharacterized protein n=1 Tax=Oopsacas minuta TaxID=111878 RepID=A0AAV7JK14_9METZ|nr:hypothetical protein LOD99_6850 [Oopsacas minuta]